MAGKGVSEAMPNGIFRQQLQEQLGHNDLIKGHPVLATHLDFERDSQSHGFQLQVLSNGVQFFCQRVVVVCAVVPMFLPQPNERTHVVDGLPLLPLHPKPVH